MGMELGVLRERETTWT